MVLKADGEITSESETEDLDDNKEEEKNDVEEVFMEEGPFLMVRRMLGNQVVPLDQIQRDNIFHARCNVKGRLCSLIIDGGSCANVASSILVSKLKLETKPHPKPYKLQWLSDEGVLTVSEQVVVGITMGQYQDQVLCDVVPMEASHILLGRPWQYDKKAIHDGYTNEVSFVQKGKKFILKPLSPEEVNKDQVRMRETRLGEWSDKKRSKVGEKNKEKQKKSVEGETHNEGETRTKINCFARVGEVRKNFLARKPLTFLFCKENCFENENKNVLPSNDFGKGNDNVSPLNSNQTFQELEVVFQKESPNPCDPSPKMDEQILRKNAEIGGKNKIVSNFKTTNPPSLSVGNKPLDLRANPFQEGGSDVNPRRQPYAKNLKAVRRPKARAIKKTTSQERVVLRTSDLKLKGTLHLKGTALNLKGKQSTKTLYDFREFERG